MQGVQQRLCRKPRTGGGSWSHLPPASSHCGAWAGWGMHRGTGQRGGEGKGEGRGTGRGIKRGKGKQKRRGRGEGVYSRRGGPGEAESRTGSPRCRRCPGGTKLGSARRGPPSPPRRTPGSSRSRPRRSRQQRPRGGRHRAAATAGLPGGCPPFPGERDEPARRHVNARPQPHTYTPGGGAWKQTRSRVTTLGAAVPPARPCPARVPPSLQLRCSARCRRGALRQRALLLGGLAAPSRTPVPLPPHLRKKIYPKAKNTLRKSSGAGRTERSAVRRASPPRSPAARPGCAALIS